MTKSVVVVGGGLIGLSTALMLAGRGANVTVVDHGELGAGAARGNAGFMCSALVEPLAAPGMVKSVVSSLNDPTRAMRLHARAIPGMLGWGVHFARSATGARYTAGRRSLGRFNQRNREALSLLTELGAEVPLGPELIVPFKDASIGERFLKTLAPMADFGLPIPNALSTGDEMRRLVPVLSEQITCGYVLPSDHSIDPRLFVDSMIEALKKRNVTMIEHAPITSVQRNGMRIRSITTAKGTYTCDELVLAAGAGVRPLAKLFGLHVAVVPGQGYNVGLPNADGLTNPVIFEEAHAVATPFTDRIRLGGTMEFDGDTPRFDQRRVDAIIASMRRFINLDYSAPFDTWAGGRPMSPDGLPLIGRPAQYENLVMAAGHGMYGLTLSPTTALAVSELIVDGKSSIDISDFDPDRFSFRNVGPMRFAAQRSLKSTQL